MMETVNIKPICTLHLSEKKKEPHEANSEETITNAVDESLSSFGDSFKQVIYFQLEKTYHIKKQQIPFRIHDFADAIEEIFGVGARLIEMKIIQALHERVQGFVYFPEKQDLVFAEYVENLRRFL